MADKLQQHSVYERNPAGVAYAELVRGHFYQKIKRSLPVAGFLRLRPNKE